MQVVTVTLSVALEEGDDAQGLVNHLGSQVCGFFLTEEEAQDEHTSCPRTFSVGWVTTENGEVHQTAVGESHEGDEVSAG
jgi:hypothetical protein